MFIDICKLIDLRKTKAIFLIGVVLFINGCGATYPDDDFKGHFPAFNNYYYFTNFSYRVDKNVPVIEASSDNNKLFFLMDHRDNIYYTHGLDMNYKKFDTRWFFEIDNSSNTNYFFFSNTEFSSNVSFHYYELGGSAISFTNGYLFITQTDSFNWYVEADVEKNGTNYSSMGLHRLSEYNEADQSFTIIE